MKKHFTELTPCFNSRFKKQFMSLLMASAILALSIMRDAQPVIAAYRDNYINSIIEGYESGELTREEAKRALTRNGVTDSPIFDFDEDSDGNKISTKSDISVKLGEAERRLDDKILAGIDKISSNRSCFVYARHEDDIKNNKFAFDVSTKSEIQKKKTATASEIKENGKKATASEIKDSEDSEESIMGKEDDSRIKSGDNNSAEKEKDEKDLESEDAIKINDYLTISSVKHLSHGKLTEATEFDSNEKINVTLFFNIPGEALSAEESSVVYVMPEGLVAVKDETGVVRSNDRTIGRYVLKEDSLIIRFDESFVKKGKDIDGAFYYKAKAMPENEDDITEIELGGLAGSISIYKALSQTAVSDDEKVSVTASYGISTFEGDVSLRVSAVKSEDKKNAEEAFNKLLKDEKLYVRNLYTYDISFIDEDGNEVEPDGNVSISMEFTEPVVTEENAEVKIYHIENNDLNRVKDLTESSETVVSEDSDGAVQKIEFSSESFSKYAMVETGINIADLAENVFIEGAYSDDGKTWTVREGKNYKLKLKFKETNDNQFPDNDTWMTYRIPSGLYLEDTETTFPATIEDGSTYYIVEGNRMVVDSTEGIVGFQWNKNSSNYNMLLNSTNVEFYAELEGHFDKTSKRVMFSDTVVREIVVDDSHRVNIKKEGYYDNKDNKIHYTVTASAEGVSENITIEDKIDGKALSLDTDSIKISGSDKAVISSKDSRGFTIKVPKMNDGETITITYTTSVDLEKIAKSGSATFEETGNTVTAKVPGIEDKSERKHVGGISFSSFSKYGVLDDSSSNISKASNGGKVRNVTWTINANDERLVHVSYIKDTIDENSRSNLKYSGSGIKVEVTFENGSTETRNIPWSSLSRKHDYEWIYYVPKSDGKASYKVTYTTSATVYDNVYDMSVKNHAETDRNIGKPYSVNVQPYEDLPVNANKQAANVTLSDTTWIIQVNIPANGADKVIVEDQLPNIWAENRHMIDEFEELLTIDGLSDSESYRLDAGKESLVFTFYKDKAKTIEGLNASASGRVLTIVYKTKNNKDWLDYAQKSKNGYYFEHVNNAKVTLNKNELGINAKVCPPVESLIKTGSYRENKNGTLIYTYDFLIGGVNGSEVTIDDYFDTEYLSYVDKLPTDNYITQTAALIYGGEDQYYPKNDTGVHAEVTKTDTGVKFYIKDFPKNDKGEYYTKYRISYYLAIKESDAIRLALKNGGKFNIRNTAYWNSEESQVDISYEHNPIKKEYGYDANKGIAYYTITVNPSKDVLNQGKAMTLEDEFENQVIDISSIKLSADDKSGKNRASEISYSMKGNLLTFENIPDETKVVIKYEALPVFSYESNKASLTNKATLMTYSDETAFDAYFNALAKANGSIAKLKLIKYKEGDIQTPLPGAVFDLYVIENGEKKAVNDKNGHIIQFTTGSDGTATVALDYSTTGQKLFFNKQYCLVESTAPKGYTVNSENAYYFTLVAPKDNDSKNICDPENAVYQNGYVLTISNRSFWGMLLPLTGGNGTTMFYISGFIMILLGSTFILLKRYKKVCRNC